MRWGAALLWLGLIGPALHLRPDYNPPGGRGQWMFRLAPGPDGPVIFDVNDFQHPAYTRNVAALRAEGAIGRPVWWVAGRPLVVENVLVLEVWPHSSVEWPWPDQTPEQVLQPLRDAIVRAMRISIIGEARLNPGWWNAPQRTILWREVALAAASWLALPTLAVGLYLIARRSDVERVLAKLRRGICPRCDYDLTGARDRCPECGRPLEPGERAAIRDFAAQR